MSIFTRFDSPLGEILLIANGDGGIQRLALDAKTEPDPDPSTARRDDEVLRDASNANPLPILIPCHRVVAADGSGSYSCGVALKECLLTMEREAALALARHIG